MRGRKEYVDLAPRVAGRSVLSEVIWRRLEERGQCRGSGGIGRWARAVRSGVGVRGWGVGSGVGDGGWGWGEMGVGSGG